MIIKSVALKNIKSYSEDTVEFNEGITSIFGMNGAGKSTVLESIGYALFDSLPYNQADFVRKGEKTGEVDVTIIGADELEYTIVRKCGSSQAYYLIDSFGTKLEGKDEVTAKLCEILGYKVNEVGQLRSLFDNAVGVLQGTFVSEFLESASKRKSIFGPLLRIDEYDNAFKNLLSLKNLVDKRISAMDIDISRMEGNADRLGDLIKEKEVLVHERSRLQADDAAKKEELGIVKAKKNGMDDLEKTIRDIDGRLKVIEAEVKNKKAQVERAEAELKKCEAAGERLAVCEPKYREFLARQEEKIKVDVQRDRRNEVLIRHKSLEARAEASDKRLAEHKRSLAELDQFMKDVEALKPLVEQEEKLEVQKQDLMSRIKSKETDIAQLKTRMDKVRQSKGNMCPLLLDVECKSVTDFSSYFEANLKKLESEKAELENKALDSIEAIKDLGSPRHLRDVKLDRLKKRESMLAENQQIESEIAVIRKERDSLLASLKQYEGLEGIYKKLGQDIESLKPAYEEYQQNIRLAKGKDDWKKAFALAKDDHARFEAQYMTVSRSLAEKVSVYDVQMHASIKTKYESLLSQTADIAANMNATVKRLEAVEADILKVEDCLKRIGEMRQKREAEARYLAFIDRVREVIRMAGPNVIRVFIDLISREATDMYCEIAGDRRIEIKWADDYDILMIEEGREKTFKQLSGGEQMSAALAVRLAILKILTSSDLVFLDEPTQNLDESRRNNLAQEIMRIKDFRQMIIISHDDTFNANLENVIEIEKTEGKSVVRRRPGYARPQAALE
jgi:exonuclease SbcC